MTSLVARAASVLSFGLAMAIGGLAAQPAKAADIVRGVYASDPGVCGNSRVLGTISSKFGYQVRNVPNLPQVSISDFYGVRENRFQPADENHPIERRYCIAQVALSDGYVRHVWYLIEHPMGFAGIGSNVEFCVSGFDRWRVYGGNCRTLY